MMLLLACVMLVAFLSLCSYLYCWHDIRRGRPHILSLRQITLIMDRNRLDSIFGHHQKGYYYQLNPAALAMIVRSRRGFVFFEVLADTFCLWGSYRYLAGLASMQTVGLFVVLAAVCQGIDVWFSMRLVRAWWPQIQEEIDNTGE